MPVAAMSNVFQFILPSIFTTIANITIAPEIPSNVASIFGASFSTSRTSRINVPVIRVNSTIPTAATPS